MNKYNLDSLDKTSLSTMNSLLSSTSQLASYIKEIQKSIGSSRSIDAFRSIAEHSEAMKQLVGSSRSIDAFRSIAEHSEAMSSSLADIVGKQSEYMKQLGALNLASAAGKNSEAMKRLLVESELHNQLKMTSSLARAARAEKLIHSSLAELKLKEIGKLISITDTSRESIITDFDKFSSAYSNLAELRDSGFFRDFPEKITIEQPALEMLETASLLNVLSTKKLDIQLEGQKDYHRKEIQTEIGALEELLLEIGAVDLIAMWQGALDALESRHADYARHCSISLRELLTHTIHKLAPDSDIFSWTNDPKLFDKNRPTRKARLLFICRSINHDVFIDFVNKDIDAILEFFQLFQRGTHQVIIPYTHTQLLTLKAKIESTISFLIEIWKLNNA
jgi:hypothetical protein